MKESALTYWYVSLTHIPSLLLNSSKQGPSSMWQDVWLIVTFFVAIAGLFEVDASSYSFLNATTLPFVLWLGMSNELKHKSCVPFKGVGKIFTKFSSELLLLSKQPFDGRSSSESCSMTLKTELLEPVIPVLVLGASIELFEMLFSEMSLKFSRVLHFFDLVHRSDLSICNLCFRFSFSEPCVGDDWRVLCLPPVFFELLVDLLFTIGDLDL